jgi:hypothetical protein
MRGQIFGLRPAQCREPVRLSAAEIAAISLFRLVHRKIRSGLVHQRPVR